MFFITYLIIPIILLFVILVVSGILLFKKMYKPLVYFLIIIFFIVLQGSYQHSTESCSEKILYGEQFLDSYEVKQVSCYKVKKVNWLIPRWDTVPTEEKEVSSYFINGQKADISLKIGAYFKRFGDYLYTYNDGIVIIRPDKIIKIEDDKKVLEQLFGNVGLDWIFANYYGNTLYNFDGDNKKIISYNLDNHQLKTFADLKDLPVKNDSFRAWQRGYFVYENNEPVLLRFETNTDGFNHHYEYNLKTKKLTEVNLRASNSKKIHDSAWQDNSNVVSIESQKTNKKAKNYKLRYPINLWFDLHSLIFDWI
jgi:hypothetical protein